MVLTQLLCGELALMLATLQWLSVSTVNFMSLNHKMLGTGQRLVCSAHHGSNGLSRPKRLVLTLFCFHWAVDHFWSLMRKPLTTGSSRLRVFHTATTISCMAGWIPQEITYHRWCQMNSSQSWCPWLLRLFQLSSSTCSPRHSIRDLVLLVWISSKLLLWLLRETWRFKMWLLCRNKMAGSTLVKSQETVCLMSAVLMFLLCTKWLDYTMATLLMQLSKLQEIFTNLTFLTEISNDHKLALMLTQIYPIANFLATTEWDCPVTTP